MQKARRDRTKPAPTACKHTVSGTISLPFRGTFHLSLTVLVNYRSPRSTWPCWVAPAGSDQVSRARPYSGACPGRPRVFAYGTVTRCGSTFQSIRLTRGFVTSRPAGRRIKTSPTTLARQRLPSITSHEFGLFPFRSPLLRESRFLSFPPGTKMFQFPGLPLPALFDSGGSTRALPRVGFPIRKSPDQRMVSTSPGLIAAAHVRHRLLAPRHPPCALRHLTRKNTFYCRY